MNIRTIHKKNKEISSSVEGDNNLWILEKQKEDVFKGMINKKLRKNRIFSEIRIIAAIRERLQERFSEHYIIS